MYSIDYSNGCSRLDYYAFYTTTEILDIFQTSETKEVHVKQLLKLQWKHLNDTLVC